VSVKDMTGRRFGSLTVLGREPSDTHGNARWRCSCDCGKEIVTHGYALRSGHTRSCGHLQKQVATEAGTHHMSNTRLYKVWSGMKQRCENPKNKAYHDYGAKGITVCKEWHDFEVFYKWAVEQGYKPGLTIERQDNSKGYCPENCRLASRTEQNRNTTRTHRIKHGDRLLTAAEAGKLAGVDRCTVAKWARGGLVSSLDDVFKLKAKKGGKGA